MWELNHKEVWTPKNCCFWTVVLEKGLESPLDKKIKPINLKGNQPWIFIGRTDAEAEAPILWPPDVKSWLIWKDPTAGKDWGQEEKGMTGWDGWMASLTQWTWVWVSSGSWWWAGKPGVLHFMGLQRVGHDWAAELNWTELTQWTWVWANSRRYWRTRKPSMLQSTGLRRVRHELVTEQQHYFTAQKKIAGILLDSKY